MKAVFEHELNLYYRSMTAYLFGAFLLLFTGVGALIYNLSLSVSNFEYVLDFISIGFVIIVPILTMRVLSEERRQKTDQLLYSLPIKTSDIILGKFFALAVIYAVPVIIIAFYPLLFSRFGDVFLPTSYGSLFAFFLMGLAFISLGMFISGLTESQGIAAGVCLVVMLFNYFSTTLAEYVSGSASGSFIALAVFAVLIGLLLRFLTKSDIIGAGFSILAIVALVILLLVNAELLEGLLPALMADLSLFQRFTVFVRGIFDLGAIIFYLSVIVFFLFLSVQTLEKRRYNG